ncbi:TIGR02647 family protein [Kangiella sp. TOML190]|uniref:TIGR02647 family protein n=1 Tax=Kangiella sp. TOML190 TaxID=2931351 RepID=UPI00203DC0AE|nr:TIGR02647 family protein [Kangiella sp. TOML190]
MPISQELLEEIKLLSLFNLETTQQGIKIHSDATKSSISAAQRLYDKGIVTLPDGGYLTDMGHEAAEHAQLLLSLLKQ